MRKILIILFALFFIICCGCSNNETVSNSEVVINMPTDNTVNGYRTESIESETINTSSETESKVISSNAETTSNKTEIEKPTNNTTTQYCANTNSKKFHLPDCSSVDKIKEENRLFLSNRSELIELGYEPCKRCNP